MADDPIQIDVRTTASLTPAELDSILALFQANYDEADAGYITRSVDTLKYIALASTGSKLVGFGFGETRIMPLPRLSDTEAVALAGMSCVDPAVRQRGLFAQMALHVLHAGGNVPADRPYLFCGRMAHAVSYRTIAKMSPACIPAPGVVLSDWHRETLEAAAAAFGVSVEVPSGVVKGPGRPVGYPKLAYEPTDAERALFEGVDRARGDSLLTVAWLPNAPAGW